MIVYITVKMGFNNMSFNPGFSWFSFYSHFDFVIFIREHYGEFLKIYPECKFYIYCKIIYFRGFKISLFEVQKWIRWHLISSFPDL